MIVFGQGAGALIAAHFLFGKRPRPSPVLHSGTCPVARRTMPPASPRRDAAVGALPAGLRVPSPTYDPHRQGLEPQASGNNRTGIDWLSEDFAVVRCLHGRSGLRGRSNHRRLDRYHEDECACRLETAPGRGCRAICRCTLPPGGGAAPDEPPVTATKGRMVQHLKRRLARARLRAKK